MISSLGSETGTSLLATAFILLKPLCSKSSLTSSLPTSPVDPNTIAVLPFLASVIVSLIKLVFLLVYSSLSFLYFSASFFLRFSYSLAFSGFLIRIHYWSLRRFRQEYQLSVLHLARALQYFRYAGF